MAPEQISARYLRFLYLSMMTTLVFFCIIPEEMDIWYFLPLLLISTTHGYLYRPQWITKNREKWLSIFFMAVLLIGVTTTNDAIKASSYLLVVYCATVFYRERAVLSTHVSLLPILGLMLIATFFTSQLFYLPFFLVCIYLFSHLLFYFHLHRFAQAAVQAKTEYQLDYLVSPTSGTTNVKAACGKVFLAAAVIVLIVVSFFLIPRTTWEFQISGFSKGRETGFGQKIENQTVSQMMLRQSVHFIVETTELNPPYFKGIVYNHYTGKAWENRSTFRALAAENYDGEKSFIFGHLPGEEELAKLTKEKYVTRDYEGANLIFRGAPRLIQTRGYWGKELRIRDGGDLQSLRPLGKGSNYTLFTDLSATACPSTEAEEWRECLQLPPISQRVKDLAGTLARDSREGQVAAVQKHLASYPYTLDMNPGGSEWVDYFLFEAQKGYCIHFATAMVVFLRLHDIPARVVGGFLGKIYDADGQFYILTNEHAHAWVEVYFPDRGWVVFDPTPAQENYVRGPAFWTFMYYRLRNWWLSYIIGFSYTQQRIIYRFIQETLLVVLRSPLLWAGVLACAGLWLLLRRRQWTGKASVPSWVKMLTGFKDRRAHACLPGYRFYQEMLEHLKKLGMERTASETPYEFIARAGADCPAIMPYIAEITRQFCDVRFGHYALEETRVKEIDDSLRKLANAVREITEEKQKLNNR